MCPWTTLECVLLGILDYATRITTVLAVPYCLYRRVEGQPNGKTNQGING